MPLWRMGYSGFFRCSTVRAALAPREHGHRLRLRFAAPGHGSLQALSDTPSAVSIARPPPHPSHSFACEGLAPENPPPTAEQHRRPEQGFVLPSMSKGPLNIAVAVTGMKVPLVYFQGISPRHQAGMRRRPGNERLPKAALLQWFRVCLGAGRCLVGA